MAEPHPAADPGASDEALMAEYQITCVPADRFHYKSFRYSRLVDAVAQAKRDRLTPSQKGN